MNNATENSANRADRPETGASRISPRQWRFTATILGLIAGVCAVAIPFMPIVQDTARIVWPDGQNTKPVNAPLTGYWAEDTDVTVPCPTVRSVDARTEKSATLFSTVPPERTGFGAGVLITVNDRVLTVVNRGEQVAEEPLTDQGCDIHLSSDAYSTTVRAGDRTLYDAEGDKRARVVGIYSDITSAKDPIDRLSVSITPDTRYQSAPTVWKTVVSIIGVLALIGCLVAVNRSDIRVARRAPRWLPVGWWRLNARDITVIAALAIWVIIGPVTSDDGYILSMARIRDDVGYLTNYYRWFGVAEAPIGWFYHVFEVMAHVSTAPPWIRLPSFLLGVLSWFLISREVLPRLGTAVRTSRAAGWTAASVFLIWWMPFNNGLRPEPVAAVGSLLALTAVERALVTRRLLPACLGLLTAAFTVAAAPTGMIAVAPFLVSARPLFKLLRSRARDGWTSVLAPLFAAGTSVLFVVFADQTFATVVEATRLRALVGPALSWYEEFSRYELLFSDSADGSVSRRFPVLLIVLCLVTCLAVLLRRGRIPGAALGPSRRLIGTVGLFFPLLMLTPTKWTHHFGAFAAVGAAIAALTALATSSSVLRSKRNRAAFLSGLLFVAALSATGPNSYWFVSKFGVPWNDIPPQLAGITAASVLIAGALIVGAFAFVENIRTGEHASAEPRERPGRALVLGSVSLVTVCGLVAISEFGSMAKAIVEQRHSYSLGGANIEHLYSDSCNLSDHVQVERNTSASVLRLLPPDQQRTLAERTAQPPDPTLPPLQRTTEQIRAGFHTQPVAHDDPIGKPPNGLDRDKVPMWSSFRDKTQPTGHLRTGWYRLPDDAVGKKLVISMAGAAEEDEAEKATSVKAEFGTRTPRGVKVVRSEMMPKEAAETGTWAQSRIDAATSQDEQVVRLVVQDNDLTEEGWIALTTPRVPTFTSLTNKIGNTPTYMDWPAGFVHPCANLPATHNGISEIPKYRITAMPLAGNDDVSSNKGGGPLGWIEEVANQPEVPSYLDGEPDQQWGQLLRVEPYADGAPPKVVEGEVIRPGWWSPGPGPTQPDGETRTR